MQVQNAAVSSTMDKPSPQNKGVGAGKAEKAGQAKPTPDKMAQSAEQKTTEQTSPYLKVVSRIENFLQSEEGLPDNAIEGFTKAITNRLKLASEQDKQMVATSPEAKALGIDGADEISEKIADGLDDRDDAPKALALLKHPKFIELMAGEDKQASKTYGPDGKSNQAQNAGATDTKKMAPKEAAPTAPQPGSEAVTKQAIEKLKAMQAAAAKGAAANPTPKQTIAA